MLPNPPYKIENNCSFFTVNCVGLHPTVVRNHQNFSHFSTIAIWPGPDREQASRNFALPDYSDQAPDARAPLLLWLALWPLPFSFAGPTPSRTWSCSLTCPDD